MKITIKIKHLIILLITAGLSLYACLSASAEGPTAYVRYDNSGSTVTAYVYWDDTDEYHFAWADSMDVSGKDLDWHINDSIKSDPNSAENYVAISLTKYKNYYFKIFNDSDITIVRSYPADYNNSVNPGAGRKQNDYAHGNFTPDTAMCGTCHSSHNSLKGQLLKQATYYDLCMVCHSNSNSQSKYDVELGMVYMGPQAKWVNSTAGPVGAGVAASAHDINDNFNTTVQVPGNDPDPSKVLTFTCISCHTAHGGTNDNYRLIRSKIYPSNGNRGERNVTFTAYSVVTDLFAGEQVSLISGTTEFCSSCHSDFAKGNAMQGGGEYSIYKRHPVSVGDSVYSVLTRNFYPTPGDNLPLQYYADSPTADKRTAVVCETCHFAHGSRKSFVVTGNEQSGGNMLRLDNYGVCESCHKK